MEPTTKGHLRARPLCRRQGHNLLGTDFSSEDIPLLFPLTGAANAVFLGDSVLDYRANAVALVITRSF